MTGTIRYSLKSCSVTLFIIAYVSMGGLRSIVWTDFIQGIMMVGFTLTAFIIIAHKSGGFVATHNKINMVIPSLFSRPGNNNAMGFGVWFGYMFLWFFADPMFPQLFQRFMVAKDEKSLKTTIVFYPIITTFLFFLTVSIGVMGRLTFPLLTPDKTDAIFPMLLGQYAGTILSTLLLTGSIAALMSTMDSQLLTLTSMVTTDFFKIKKNEILKEKLTVIGLGVLGLIIAIKPSQCARTGRDRRPVLEKSKQVWGGFKHHCGGRPGSGILLQVYFHSRYSFYRAHNDRHRCGFCSGQSFYNFQ
jgi:SSS family solute:Na+ symporter